MNGDTTVDEKPVMIRFKEAHACSRPAVNTNSTPPLTMTPPTAPSALPYGFPGSGTPPYGFPYPICIPTPFPYNYTPTTESPQNPTLLSSNLVDLRQPAPSPVTLVPSAGPSSSSVSSLKPSEIPEVIAWFEYLDKHEDRNGDDVRFAPFGPILHELGFRRISQLTDRDFLDRSDLEHFLNIKTGTAVSILQYAKQDLEGIRSGKLKWPFM